MYKKLILTFIAIFLLLYISCEKITGYNYQAEPQNKAVKISGNVINKFTNQPVDGATVKIGSQITSTDTAGAYLIYYILQTDEERDKPVEVRVTAENYIPYNQQVVLYPTETEINIELIYGAPKIEENVLVPYILDFVPIYVCQARVMDYQGLNDIDSVRAIFYYENQQDNVYEKVTVPMQFVSAISDQAAYYQGYTYTKRGQAEITSSYAIEAKDRQGFTHYLTDYITAMNPDHFLFPPNL